MARELSPERGREKPKRTGGTAGRPEGSSLPGCGTSLFSSTITSPLTMNVSRVIRSARAPPSLVAKFLLRESPSSVPDQPSSPLLPFASTSANPFLPSKANADANSWTAPRYSLRRQKVLRNEVARLGLDPTVLPPSAPHRARLESAAPLFRAGPHIRRASVLNEAELEKKGPYVGRKGAAFKGKVWERNLVARKAELAKALEGADAKIAAWRKVSSASVRVAETRRVRCRSWKLTLLLNQTTKEEKAKKTPAPF